MPLTSNEIIDLYDAHAEPLLRFLTRRTLDAQIAVDLVAESFAVAYEKRSKFKGNPQTDAPAWLFGIAKNLLNDFFRSGSAERRAMQRIGVPGVEVSDEEALRIEQLAGSEFLRSAVAEAISELSAEHRDALRLRVVDELSYPEVAQQLQVTEDVARARVSRGLRKLRKRLEPMHPDEVIANV